MGIDRRKAVEIEKLLQWAYRDELPKRSDTAAIGISPMFRLADLGTRVDDWSVDPGFPAALGAPHPDALLIDAAVNRLPELGLDWNRSRSHVIPDLLHWVGPDDPILSAMTFQPAGLLALHARMAMRPVWDLGPVQVLRVMGKNGKPVVQYLDDFGELVDGRTSGRHYGPGARCPLRLDPPAHEIAYARAEYLVWRDALEQVRQRLCAWNLHDHRPLPPLAAAEPWFRDTEPKPRILQSLHPIKEIA